MPIPMMLYGRGTLYRVEHVVDVLRLARAERQPGAVLRRPGRRREPGLAEPDAPVVVIEPARAARRASRDRRASTASIHPAGSCSASQDRANSRNASAERSSSTTDMTVTSGLGNGGGYPASSPPVRSVRRLRRPPRPCTNFGRPCATDPPPDRPVPRQPRAPLDPPGRAALACVWNHQRVGLGLLVIAWPRSLWSSCRPRAAHHAPRRGAARGRGRGRRRRRTRPNGARSTSIEDLGVRSGGAAPRVHAGDHELQLDPERDRLPRRRRRHGPRRAPGRAQRNPVDTLTGVVRRAMRPDDGPLVFRYDPAGLPRVIDSWVGATGKGLVDGGLRFDGAQVAEIRPDAGIGIDRDEAERRILARARTGFDGARRARDRPDDPCGRYRRRPQSREARRAGSWPRR